MIGCRSVGGDLSLDFPPLYGQATVGVGTVLVVYMGVTYTRGGAKTGQLRPLIPRGDLGYHVMSLILVWTKRKEFIPLIVLRLSCMNSNPLIHLSLQSSHNCPSQPTVIVPQAHWEAYGRGSLP